jgi:hypothetical protein
MTDEGVTLSEARQRLAQLAIDLQKLLPAIDWPTCLSPLA